MYVCMYVYQVLAWCMKKMSDHLELELQQVVSSLVWVLGTEPELSEKNSKWC